MLELYIKTEQKQWPQTIFNLNRSGKNYKKYNRVP